MVFDRTENEPEEYDPEEEFRDPDSDSITIPRVSSEDAGSDLRSDLRSEFEADESDASFADVDPDLLRNFWALVLVINGAVLAYALAALFLIFEGAVTYSAYLLAAGLALTGFGVRRYRLVRRELGSENSSAETAGADATGDSRTTASAETADTADGDDAVPDGAEETDSADDPGERDQSE